MNDSEQGRKQNTTRIAAAEGRRLISIVVPAHNEESNVAALYGELEPVCRALEEDYEILFVDDGSTDGTASAVKKLAADDPHIRLIRLIRNFGHQAALIAGFCNARGDAVVSLDCDLQHPPRYVGEMVTHWRQGARVVQMVRTRTEGIPRIKGLLSALFYKLINLVSSTELRTGVADFFLIDRVLVNELVRLRDHRPFIRGIIAWFGVDTVNIEFEAPRRHAGKPSYSFRKSASLGGQAITMLSRVPLRMGLYLGFFTALLSMGYLVFVLYAHLQGEVIEGWSSVIVSILALGSIQLIVLGIMGEYILQIYERAREVPAYIAYEED